MATTSNTNNGIGVSYVEWGPIFAGTIVALAVSLILIPFGQAIGLSFPERFNESHTAVKVLCMGMWLLWTQLMASMTGAYLAGRMRGPWGNTAASESEVRDGVHGLLVWATSTIIAVLAAGIMGALTALAAHHGIDGAQEAGEKLRVIPEAVARKYGAIFAFSAAASALVSSVAAYWMGTVGGDHRDGELALGRASFRNKAKKK